MIVSAYLNTRALALTLLMSLMVASVSLASSGVNEKNKKENVTKHILFPADPAFEWDADLESETAESLGIDTRYFYSIPTAEAMVYDAEGNVVAQGALDEFGFPVSSGLQEAMRNASLMMTYEGVHYYRVD